MQKLTYVPYDVEENMFYHHIDEGELEYAIQKAESRAHEGTVAGQPRLSVQEVLRKNRTLAGDKLSALLAFACATRQLSTYLDEGATLSELPSWRTEKEMLATLRDKQPAVRLVEEEVSRFIRFVRLSICSDGGAEAFAEGEM